MIGITAKLQHTGANRQRPSQANQCERSNISVAVLLSTFNGERYLEELLDSVLSQHGVDVTLIIRDDGSTDATQRILKRYASRNDQIYLHIRDNVGVVNSFNELMADPAADMCDYIAFCDQDDVWADDKLRVAIDQLQRETRAKDCPALYCSNLLVVNESLEPRGEMRRRGIVPTKEGVLVQNVGTGCTEVFNQKARELYLQGLESAMEMHDYWMTLVCIFMGELIYDDEPHILYRQHEANVVGASSKSVFTALQNLMHRGNSKRISMLKDFQDTYKYFLSSEDRRILNLVIQSSDTLSAKMRLLLSGRYVGFNRSVTIGFKLRTLLGQLY